MKSAMRPEKPATSPKQTLTILWLALFAAMFVYYFVAHITRSARPVQGSQALALILTIAGLLDYGFAWWWHAFKIARPLEQARRAASQRSKTELLGFLQQLQVSVIVFLAVVEATVLYGFINRIANAYYPQLMEHFLVVNVIIFIVFRRGTMAEIFRLYNQVDSI